MGDEMIKNFGKMSFKDTLNVVHHQLEWVRKQQQTEQNKAKQKQNKAHKQTNQTQTKQNKNRQDSYDHRKSTVYL